MRRHAALRYAAHQEELRKQAEAATRLRTLREQAEQRIAQEHAVQSSITTSLATEASQGVLIQQPCTAFANDNGWYDWNIVQSMQHESPPLPGCFRTYSVGDLQGNAFRLIMFLYRLGFITLTQDGFETLRDLYANLESLQKNDLVASAINGPTQQQFQVDQNYYNSIDQVLRQHLRVNPSFIRVLRLVLLGDMLCDRGACDIMTLCLLKWMADNGIQFTIILSNHDLFFLEAYERGFDASMLDEFPFICFNPSTDPNQTYISTLSILLADQAVKTSMCDIVRRVYLPRLRLVDYNLVGSDGGEPKLYIYSHTPFVASLFAKCSSMFSIVASMRSQTEKLHGITTAFNAANEEFRQQWISNPYFFWTQKPGQPYYEFVWNRDPKHALAASEQNIINVFGHVANQVPLHSTNLYNLDFEPLGRPGYLSGTMLAFRVTDNSQAFVTHHTRLARQIFGETFHASQAGILSQENEEYLSLVQQHQHFVAQTARAAATSAQQQQAAGSDSDDDRAPRLKRKTWDNFRF